LALVPVADSDDIESSWNHIKQAFISTSRDVLGFAKQKKSKKWISEETYKLVDERKALKSHTTKGTASKKHYNFLCREIRRRCRKDRESFVNGICEEVEQAQIQKKSRKVYEGIKKIKGVNTSLAQVIKDKTGKILTDPNEIKDRWTEHFKELYNPINPTDDSVLLEIPQDHGQRMEDCTPDLSRDELSNAILRLKTGKAPGIDKISAEEIVASGEEGMQALFSLCHKIWQKEEFPEEWKRSIILPIHKKKDKLQCDNYRGISLLCHSQKLMASVMLQRIKARTEEILSEAQAGFRAGRSTIDQLFSLRLLAEKYYEHERDLYICYVDFQKAFDSVWRKGLWQVMRHLGYDNKIIRLLESMYRRTVSSVRVGTQGELSSWFETLVGVLQGCVLSPLLFNIMLEVVMALSLNNSDIGATISGFLCSNLRFADDIALLAESESDLQSHIDSLHANSTRFGLKISTSKTEVQCISRNPTAVSINIGSTVLAQVDQFTYLGGVTSNDARCENDIKRRIGLATGASASLSTIWAAKEISKHTKIRVYQSLVLSILLYNSETWTLREVDKRRLLVFEMSVLRRILGITRRDSWRNLAVRSQFELIRDVVQEIQQRRLGYFGHVCRMKGHRIPNIVLHGRIHGTRPVGRPRRRWFDGIRDDCIDMGISTYEAVKSTQDRVHWRTMMKKLPRRTSVSQRP